ncbi:MAG: NAD(+)/NADH kinase [Mariprofundaceae bacterium]
MSHIRKIGIDVKPPVSQSAKLLGELVDWLGQRHCQCVLASTGADAGLPLPCLPLEAMPDSVDMMIVLGGDGSLLHVARRFIGSSIPIMGINLGRLGFLTDIPVHGMFEVIDQVLQGNYVIERRFSLNAETWRNGERVNVGTAINDVVMQRNQHPRMIGFEMRLDGKFVFGLRADGLVLATPTGSTAYALSAGGPIVHPSIDALSVVPISPHILSNRPILVPAEEVVELRLTESPAPASLNLDGQVHQELIEGDRVLVSRGDSVSLAFLPDRNYYEVLRSKLHWGGPVKAANAR